HTAVHSFPTRRSSDLEAESLLKRALAIGEQHWGPEHLTMANRLNSLADLYREQGKYEEAESMQRRALTIREHQLGTTHPYTASRDRKSTRLNSSHRTT